MVSPAFPGMFFCFAAMVLLIFVSVSPPVWDKISFLNVNQGSSQTVYGVFGMCLKGGQCTRRSLGYNLQAAGVDNVNMNSSLLHDLTKVFILHPIVGALALLAFLFGLMGVGCASRFATILMSMTALVATIAGLVVFVIDMVVWNVLKNRVKDAGINATLGNANWLTIGAVVSLMLATCTSGCGAFGRFATGRAAGEKY